MNQELHQNSQAALDPQYIQTVIQVLNQHELAQGLSEVNLRGLALEAIKGGHLQDAAWLEMRLEEYQRGDANLEATPPKHQDLLGSDEATKPTTKEAPSSLPTIEVSKPAIITCQEDLDKVVCHHKDWMDSVLDSQKQITAGRANLRGADLSGLDLRGVDLSCADFTEAQLIGTQLAYAKLSRCKFTNAILQKANLRGAKLKKAQLRGADLREANLEEVDLTEVDLTEVNLEKATLPKKDG